MAAAGLLIGVGTAIAESEAAKKAASNQEDFIKRENELQRAFSERMYKNRYQFTVKDLEKAGLNRILAVSGLSGSAASAGMIGGSQQAQTRRIAEKVTTTAKQAATLSPAAQTAKSIAIQEKNKEQTTAHEVSIAGSESNKRWNEALKTRHEVDTAEANKIITQAQVPLAVNTAEAYNTEAGKVARKVDLFMKSIRGRGATGAK